MITVAHAKLSNRYIARIAHARTRSNIQNPDWKFLKLYMILESEDIITKSHDLIHILPYFCWLFQRICMIYCSKISQIFAIPYNHKLQILGSLEMKQHYYELLRYYDVTMTSLSPAGTAAHTLAST